MSSHSGSGLELEMGRKINWERRGVKEGREAEKMRGREENSLVFPLLIQTLIN